MSLQLMRLPSRESQSGASKVWEGVYGLCVSGDTAGHHRRAVDRAMKDLDQYEVEDKKIKVRVSATDPFRTNFPDCEKFASLISRLARSPSRNRTRKIRRAARARATSTGTAGRGRTTTATAARASGARAATGPQSPLGMNERGLSDFPAEPSERGLTMTHSLKLNLEEKKGTDVINIVD